MPAEKERRVYLLTYRWGVLAGETAGAVVAAPNEHAARRYWADEFNRISASLGADDSVDKMTPEGLDVDDLLVSAEHLVTVDAHPRAGTRGVRAHVRRQ